MQWARELERSLAAIGFASQATHDRDVDNLLHAGDSESLLQDYCTTRMMTEVICTPLQNEDFVVQSMPDCSPAKWHLAHTTWFFEQFVLKQLSGYRPYRSEYATLFNSYYQAIGPQHPRPLRGTLSRPTVKEVFEYRAHVDGRLQDLLEGRDLTSAQAGAIRLGLHHEQQHQELLLTDIKHLLGSNPLQPPYRRFDAGHSSRGGKLFGNGFHSSRAGFDTHAGGLFAMGSDEADFSFDNERPRHEVFVGPFRLARSLVTNREFLEFIEVGGYHFSEFWLAEGWDTVAREGWQQPLYWDEQRETVYTLDGPVPLDPDEAVAHLSYFEADAYARWAGARLPREEEWEFVARNLPVEGNLLESGNLHPVAASGASASNQMFGDVWEWTQSAYAPYPGFRPLAGQAGEYNGKFMVNQQVLRGGSCATATRHVRSTYRNYFPPSARWQFSGLRLAMDL